MLCARLLHPFMWGGGAWLVSELRHPAFHLCVGLARAILACRLSLRPASGQLAHHMIRQVLLQQRPTQCCRPATPCATRLASTLALRGASAGMIVPVGAMRSTPPELRNQVSQTDVSPQGNVPDEQLYRLRVVSALVGDELWPVRLLAAGRFNADCIAHFTSGRRAICQRRHEYSCGAAVRANGLPQSCRLLSMGEGWAGERSGGLALGPKTGGGGG